MIRPWTRFCCCLLVIGLVGAGQSTPAAAADKKADKSKSAKKPVADVAIDPNDTYALPKPRARELIAFIGRLIELKPGNDEERKEQREKVYPAIKQAAEKLAEVATDKEKKLKGYRDAMSAAMYVRALGGPNAVQRTALFDELRDSISASPTPSLYAAKAARALASQMERGDAAQAAALYREFAELLAKSKDPEIVKIAKKMEGIARRITLVGKPLELSGTTVSGGKFNWSKYRGKVVLVDFWATWCGPCKQELPNVLKNYGLYHERGFEVVGISVDDDKAALRAFLAENEIPWTTLYNGGWDVSPMANYYGVTGIPTVFLVNGEGEVVSISARGKELGDQLEKLLGPAELAEK